MTKDSKAIELLLDMQGVAYPQGRGYWIKVEAWLVEASEAIPHGIRYCLTLHNPGNKRILGYDNAHAVKSPKGSKHARHVVEHDHKHTHVADEGVPYEFKGVYKLLEDFFADVSRVLEEEWRE